MIVLGLGAVAQIPSDRLEGPSVLFLILAGIAVGPEGLDLVGLASFGGPESLSAIVGLSVAIITGMVPNDASVVLMLPIAVEVAGQLGVNAFAFALAVTFATSTPLLRPVGYRTNRMVYGPGGYTFTDFARVVRRSSSS